MLHIDPAIYRLLDTGSLDGLKQALQHAIELEHATMPPYLYAMYSLGGGNTEISGMLFQIAKEEMLHMLLAGNMLKAIGGAPVIDTPKFVPNYPTPLPGTVAEELIVPLRPFSRDAVEKVFMRIEQPETPLDFKTMAAAPELAPAKTIGEFYGRIRKVFEDEGDSIIIDKTGDKQPQTRRFNANQVITTAAKAKAAIDLIVEQGEGTSTEPFFPPVPDSAHLAHYYRFAEMVKGKLKPNPAATPATPPDQRYFYDSKDPIAFDQTLVLRLPDNPKAADYAVGSPARIAIDEFNRAYTRVLKLLHGAFNGSPDQLGTAINAMQDMDDAAVALTAIDAGNGMRVGPPFEYLA